MAQEIIRSDRVIQAGAMSKQSIAWQMYTAVALLQLNVAYLAEHVELFADLTSDEILAACHHARLKMVDATPAQKLDSEIFLRLKGLL